MKNRDWGSFWRNAFREMRKGWRGALLVPVFHVLLNPDVTEPDYLRGFLISVRIALEIGFFISAFHTLFYAIIYVFRPELTERLRASAKSRGLLAFAFMLISLYFASLIEPYFSGLSFGIRGLTTGALMGGIMMLVFLLHSAYKDLARHNLALRAESAESSLRTLKNQLQPHFLFNSLNSLAELIDVNPTRAAEMAQKLSDLYRMILESSSHQLCSLSHERAIIESYLELEKVRHGKRLTYMIKTTPDDATCFIPTLILQTLVENAIKHGIRRTIEGGRVDVLIERGPDEGFIATVANTLSSSAGPIALGSGTGLANARARLALLYGPRGSLSTEKRAAAYVARFWFSGAELAPRQVGT
jgi:hypothetical protein